MMRTRGMTLLEIMVAVAVVAIMVGLAVMGMQDPIDRGREREASRELWSSTLRARQRAVSTNQPVRIVVEPDVERADGTRRTVARWERLKCDNAWDAQCPQDACTNTTCRADADCCDEVGPDIVLPDTMNAGSVHGLCFLAGSGRAVRPGDLSCMRDDLDDTVAVNAAAAAARTLPLNFTWERGQSRTLLLVEPLTGLTEVLDCDSQMARERDLAACD